MKKFLIFASLIVVSSLNAESMTIDFGNISGSTTARLIQLILGMGVLALAPSLVIMTTSFTRIVIIFSFLRNALGLQQSPPNVVLVSLALFLSVFIMSPTLDAVYQNGIVPLVNEKITEQEAFQKISEPMKKFMLAQTREKDLKNFISLDSMTVDKDNQRKLQFSNPNDIPLKIIVPAFMISEIKKAFEIGFLIFLPFLVIDMVVSSILMAMGMMMLPPVMISLPFKIIFFVLVDGWEMITQGIVRSFNF